MLKSEQAESLCCVIEQDTLSAALYWIKPESYAENPPVMAEKILTEGCKLSIKTNMSLIARNLVAQPVSLQRFAKQLKLQCIEIIIYEPRPVASNNVVF